MKNAGTLPGQYDVGTDAVYHTLQAQHDPLVVDGLLGTNDFGASALDPDGLYNECFSNAVAGGFSKLHSQQPIPATVIWIAAGSLDNARDPGVSPQHRICPRHWRSELLFGDRKTLAAVRHRVNAKTIRQIEFERVECFLVLLDAPEIIFAKSRTSESFHPGSEGLAALSEETRAEGPRRVASRETAGLVACGSIARSSLKVHEASVFAQLCATGMAA